MNAIKNSISRSFTFVLFVLALTLFLASCQSRKKAETPSPSTTQKDTPQSQTLTLELAKSGTLKFSTEGNREDVVFLEFAKVVGDSRCPLDVNCVWAGNVQIAVNIAVNDTKNDWRILSIGAKALSKLEFEGYTFELVEVNPYPKTQLEKNALPYSAKIKVYPTPITNP
ncbi:hypothetical protein [Chryseobacterium sp. A301]